jgi:hypothetical protein
MISGTPPGRVARLAAAWTDWLFAKLEPPKPKLNVASHPPKLVKSGEPTTRAA